MSKDKRMANLQIRIDDDLRDKAQQIAQDLGMDLTTTVRIFLKQMVHNHGLPFIPKLDNNEYIVNVGCPDDIYNFWNFNYWHKIKKQILLSLTIKGDLISKNSKFADFCKLNNNEFLDARNIRDFLPCKELFKWSDICEAGGQLKTYAIIDDIEYSIIGGGGFNSRPTPKEKDFFEKRLPRYKEIIFS